MKDSADCDNKSVLDLSKQHLRKIPKQPVDAAQHVRVLILDENELQKIDNVDSYMRIEHLSVCKNQLLRMYGVCRLHHLQQLHLAYNGILTVEGMKELSELRHLNLEGNNIKAIEHLSTNCKLEYLNLSENSIASISELSYLKCLKELNVQGNRITHLRHCDKFLPVSLETLLLAKNGITDLNEICTLSHLNNLTAISVADNPCVQMTGSVVGFDYRPFVLNWCMTVKSIDGFIVNPIESLKAEWLYSQGRGRQFRVGEQQSLARYLSSMCPLSGEVLENENERKLRLILSKAQQHQRQLKEESTTESLIINHAGSGGGSCTSTSSNSPSSARRRQAGQHQHSGNRIQSPRFSRLGRQGSPDLSISSSGHGNSSLIEITGGQHNTSAPTSMSTMQMTSSLISNIKALDQPDDGNNIMVQSLDPHILNAGVNSIRQATMSSSMSDMRSSPQLIAMLSSNFTDNMALSRSCGSPLSAASKMVPVPESLMSPDCPPTSNVVQRPASSSLCATSARPLHGTSNAPRKSIGKLHDSPKSTTSVQLESRPQRQSSQVLNQTRKVQQNLINSIQMQQQQAQKQQLQREQHHYQHHAYHIPSNAHSVQHALPSSSVHVTPPDAQSTTTNSDNDEEQPPLSYVLSSGKTTVGPTTVQHEYRTEVLDKGDDDVDDNEDDDEDSIDINVDKLKTIRNKVAQRCKLNRPASSDVIQNTNHLQQSNNINHSSSRSGKLPAAFHRPIYNNEQKTMSVILIQKLWRGHQARQKFKEAAKTLRSQRTQNYIEKLTADMETTKIALENERKIQQLQMQAINALWKKVSNMPTANIATDTIGPKSIGNESSADGVTNSTTSDLNVTAAANCCPHASIQSQAIVEDLAKTCSVLTSQVQQLQGSMHDILQCMTIFCQLPQQHPMPPAHPATVTLMVADTQTEITAVRTPQLDHPPFPFRLRSRPVAPVNSDLESTTPPVGKLQRPSTLPLDTTTVQSEIEAIESVLLDSTDAVAVQQQRIESTSGSCDAASMASSTSAAGQVAFVGADINELTSIDTAPVTNHRGDAMC